jgi:hypothetical protein
VAQNHNTQSPQQWDVRGLLEARGRALYEKYQLEQQRLDDEMMMNDHNNNNNNYENRMLAAHYGTKTPSVAPIGTNMPTHFGFTFPDCSICPLPGQVVQNGTFRLSPNTAGVLVRSMCCDGAERMAQNGDFTPAGCLSLQKAVADDCGCGFPDSLRTCVVPTRFNGMMMNIEKRPIRLYEKRLL